MAHKQSVTSIPTFRFTDGTRVEFWPVERVPGFSHKVLITGPGTRNTTVRDWMGDHAKPSQKQARYYHKKHGGGAS